MRFNAIPFTRSSTQDTRVYKTRRSRRDALVQTRARPLHAMRLRGQSQPSAPLQPHHGVRGPCYPPPLSLSFPRAFPPTNHAVDLLLSSFKAPCHNHTAVVTATLGHATSVYILIHHVSPLVPNFVNARAFEYARRLRDDTRVLLVGKIDV